MQTSAQLRNVQTAIPTHQGLWVAPYRYPKGMRLRAAFQRSARRGVRVENGSEQYEHTLPHHLSEQCGEQVLHYKAKGYSQKPCRRNPQMNDVVPGGEQQRRLGLGSDRLKIELPAVGKMRHPGMILPTMLSTTQAMFEFSPKKTGTCNRLKAIAGHVSDTAPRYATHDLTAMSSTVQANFQSTASRIYPNSST